MINIIIKFNKLPVSMKVRIIAAILITIVLMVAIPVYAWFANQKKAAEMYKIQYPNSLYINAAHREDQIYFDLDSVNVNELERDSNGDVIYYTDETYTDHKTKEVDGETVYDKTGVTKVIRSQKYVFSVFGTNTEKFKLQLAYTNNNQFKYNLYSATEQDTKPAGSSINYVTHSNSHTTSKAIFSSDLSILPDIPLYYVQDSQLSMTYLNIKSGSNDLLARTDDSYYQNNYGANTNVQERSVPIYCQTGNIDVLNSTSNKQFHNYFVLEVTWDTTRNAEKKETDMIAITVQRVS